MARAVTSTNNSAIVEPGRNYFYLNTSTIALLVIILDHIGQEFPIWTYPRETSEEVLSPTLDIAREVLSNSPDTLANLLKHRNGLCPLVD